MSGICPTCGHVYSPNKLAVDLTRNEVFFGGSSVKLAPAMAEMVAALVSAAPRALLHNEIIHAIWGFENEPDNASQAIKVYVCRARPLLRQLGWDIKSVFASGYMLIRLPRSNEASA